jgi:hypothetical protein
MTRLFPSCAVVVLILLVSSCKAREEPVESSNAVEALPPDTAEGAAQAGTAGDTADPEAAPAAEPGEAAQAEPSKPARDLAAELRAAVGSPADCLQDYRPSSPMTIRINISAIVRPTGMIIEPSASGRGLSANDQRCVEQRVGDVTLTPLGGEASEPVSTYVDIQYQPPSIEESDVGGPAPEQKDVVQPLPKKTPIAPSGVPIEGPAADPIEGPSGVPIEGPRGVPVEGPKPEPIEGYQVDQDAERWTD